MINLNEFVRGAIDMHLHFGPDPNFPRRLDAMETALSAQEMGLRAIVLKSLDYPTAPLTKIINRVVTQTTVFGSITLDFPNGGINPYAVDCAAKLGAKVVWMPTISSANSRKKMGRFLGVELKGEGISILDKKGDLLEPIKEILDIAKKHKMIVATGHISPKEVFKLVDHLNSIGHDKIVLSHVLDEDVMEETLSLSDQQALAKKGAFIEHCMVMLLHFDGKHTTKELLDAIRKVGAEHAIICSDLGQALYCPPAEGIRMMIGVLAKAGLSEKELSLIVKENPARLLDLD